MAAKKQRKRYNYVLTFILLILVCVMAFYSRELGQQRDAIVYPDSLELVAAEINGEELTLRELAVYVAYEEMQVEEQAVLYDSEDPGHYWNIRTQEGFTRVNARKAVMQMALHDELFYQLAQGEIELDEEEEKNLEYVEQDFWEDLTEREGDLRLGVTREDIRETLRRMAYAQKYQTIYAAMHNKESGEYDYTEETYQKLLEKQDYTIHKKVWDRVSIGSVTLEY